MIKFEDLKEVSIPEFNGGKGITKANMFMDKNIKIMKSILEQNYSIGNHAHTASCEVVYILSGTAKCILDGKEEVVKAGECHYCPKGSTHSIINEDEELLVMIDIVPEQ